MWDEIAKGAVEGLVRGILARKPSRTTEQVEAQSFVLRDEHGRGRAVLAMLEAGPGLTLLDADEGIRAVLGVGESKAFLELWGTDNRSNATFSMEGNQPDLSFYDDCGRCQVTLTPPRPVPAAFRRQQQMSGHCGPGQQRRAVGRGVRREWRGDSATARVKQRPNKKATADVGGLDALRPLTPTQAPTPLSLTVRPQGNGRCSAPRTVHCRAMVERHSLRSPVLSEGMR
jgi:hypothetical protein